MDAEEPGGPQEERSVQPLADGQRRVLRVIQQYEDATGVAPTVAYIAWRLQRDHKTIREHLQACHRKGWLRSPTPRGLRCRIG